MVKRRRKDKGEARNFLDHLGSLELSFFLIDDGSKRHWLTQKNDRAKKVVIGLHNIACVDANVSMINVFIDERMP